MTLFNAEAILSRSLALSEAALLPADAAQYGPQLLNKLPR